MGALGAVDPRSEAWRAAAQDRHAFGDERDLHLLRTGCPWRYLPPGFSPPRSTVYNIFRAFQRDGVWEAIWEELRAALRERLGREAAPAPASSTASRSSRPKRGMRERRRDAVGYDAGKKVKGRKIHALVDTEGLPLRVVVHSAAIQDRDGAALAFDRIRQRFNWLELVWADGGYNARQVESAVATQPPLGWRSSNVPTTLQDSSSCRVAGSSNEPFPGSGETGAWPRITRTSPTPSQPSSHSPASSSLSGGSPGPRRSSQA